MSVSFNRARMLSSIRSRRLDKMRKRIDQQMPELDQRFVDRITQLQQDLLQAPEERHFQLQRADQIGLWDYVFPSVAKALPGYRILPAANAADEQFLGLKLQATTGPNDAHPFSHTLAPLYKESFIGGKMRLIWCIVYINLTEQKVTWFTSKGNSSPPAPERFQVYGKSYAVNVRTLESDATETTDSLLPWLMAVKVLQAIVFPDCLENISEFEDWAKATRHHGSLEVMSKHWRTDVVPFIVHWTGLFLAEMSAAGFHANGEEHEEYRVMTTTESYNLHRREQQLGKDIARIYIGHRRLTKTHPLLWAPSGMTNLGEDLRRVIGSMVSGMPKSSRMAMAWPFIVHEPLDDWYIHTVVNFSTSEPMPEDDVILSLVDPSLAEKMTSTLDDDASGPRFNHILIPICHTYPPPATDGKMPPEKRRGTGRLWSLLHIDYTRDRKKDSADWFTYELWDQGARKETIQKLVDHLAFANVTSTPKSRKLVTYDNASVESGTSQCWDDNPKFSFLFAVQVVWQILVLGIPFYEATGDWDRSEASQQFSKMVLYYGARNALNSNGINVEGYQYDMLAPGNSKGDEFKRRKRAFLKANRGLRRIHRNLF